MFLLLPEYSGSVHSVENVWLRARPRFSSPQVEQNPFDMTKPFSFAFVLEPFKWSLHPWRLKRFSIPTRIRFHKNRKHSVSLWNHWTFQMLVFLFSSEKSALFWNALNDLFCLFFILLLVQRRVTYFKIQV